MTPFTTLTSIAAPLLIDNVDTDTIIPSREMKSTGKTGLADGLFAPWRYRDADARVADPDFVLNQTGFAQAQILLAGRNFGCGSSREHAVWALAEWGIRCIVAPSFAPIFKGNCIRNGLLPVELDAAHIAAMAGRVIMVDLPGQRIDGLGFAMDAEAKAMLTEGLDAIALTLKHQDAIAAWQLADRARRPWIYLSSPSHGDGEAYRRPGQTPPARAANGDEYS